MRSIKRGHNQKAREPKARVAARADQGPPKHEAQKPPKLNMATVHAHSSTPPPSYQAATAAPATYQPPTYLVLRRGNRFLLTPKEHQIWRQRAKWERTFQALTHSNTQFYVAMTLKEFQSRTLKPGTPLSKEKASWNLPDAHRFPQDDSELYGSSDIQTLFQKGYQAIIVLHPLDPDEALYHPPIHVYLDSYRKFVAFSYRLRQQKRLYTLQPHSVVFGTSNAFHRLYGSEFKDISVSDYNSWSATAIAAFVGGLLNGVILAFLQSMNSSAFWDLWLIGFGKIAWAAPIVGIIYFIIQSLFVYVKYRAISAAELGKIALNSFALTLQVAITTAIATALTSALAVATFQSGLAAPFIMGAACGLGTGLFVFFYDWIVHKKPLRENFENALFVTVAAFGATTTILVLGSMLGTVPGLGGVLLTGFLASSLEVTLSIGVPPLLSLIYYSIRDFFDSLADITAFRKEQKASQANTPEASPFSAAHTPLVKQALAYQPVYLLSHPQDQYRTSKTNKKGMAKPSAPKSLDTMATLRKTFANIGAIAGHPTATEFRFSPTCFYEAKAPNQQPTSPLWMKL